jgi:hypothetical protein
MQKLTVFSYPCGANFEGIEGVGEGFGWLFASQIKDRKPPINTRTKRAFLVMAISSLWL